MKPSNATIQRRIRELRWAVENDPDPVVRRIAYAVETALRWSIEDTKGWPTPLNEVLANAGLLHQELNRRVA